MFIEIDWIESIDPVTGEVVMGGGEYPIKNLQFAPQADLTGETLPVNEYSCEVITTDDIPIDSIGCLLYDGMRQLWSAWPMRKVERISDSSFRITATSWLYWLGFQPMDAKMYDGETVGAAIAECFGSRAYLVQVSPSITFQTLSGYAPAQSARDRLTWILFAVGAYIVDVFRDDMYIRPVDNTQTEIPYGRTFMRPAITENDWVTELRVTAYTYTAGTPLDTDTYVTVGGVDYIVTEQVISLSNPLAPADAPENVKEYKDINLVNDDNVNDIINRLAAYWFNRTEVSLDCINNKQYRPGDLVLGCRRLHPAGNLRVWFAGTVQAAADRLRPAAHCAADDQLPVQQQAHRAGNVQVPGRVWLLHRESVPRPDEKRTPPHLQAYDAQR